MPLSEQEQRLLDEMERHLLGNDADVVSAPTAGTSLNYRNLLWGALLVMAGVGTLIAGVALGGTWTIVVGVVAFVMMVLGVFIASKPSKTEPAQFVGKSAPSGPGAEPSLMDRLNDRWDRREQ